VQADGRQTLGFRVEVAGDGVCRGDVAGVRVRVAQEVGEGDGGEGVVVGVFFAVEFDHFGGVFAERQEGGIQCGGEG